MLSFMIGLLFSIVVLCALLLTGIILIQQSKSGGGLAVMGGGMTESVLGAAAGNVVTRVTVVLATIFMVCTFLLAILITRRAEPESFAERYERGASALTEEAVEVPLGEEAAPDATSESNLPND